MPSAIATAAGECSARPSINSRTERERPLQHRRGEGVVGEQRHRAAGVRDRPQIHLGEGRVGGRLDHDQAGVRAQRMHLRAAAASRLLPVYSDGPCNVLRLTDVVIRERLLSRIRGEGSCASDQIVNPWEARMWWRSARARDTG